MNIEAARGLNPILKGRYSSVYTKFTFFNHQSELDLTIDNEDSSGVYSSPPFSLTSVNLLRLDYQVTLTQVVKICLSAADLRNSVAANLTIGQPPRAFLTLSKCLK